MKIGRNEPCPCGSGKKYKKCCLEKDEAAARAAAQAELAERERIARIEREETARQAASERERRAAAAEPEPSRYAHLPDSVREVFETIDAANEREEPQEAREAFWDNFHDADYEGQIALVRETLAECPEVIDGENALEALATLFPECARRNEGARFDALVEELRQHSPEAYEEERAYIYAWRISNALVAGREEEMREVGLQFAAIAADYLDLFDATADQLAFHGRQSLLLEMMQAAWPKVQSASEVKLAPWAVGQFGEWIADLVTFEALEQGWALQEGGQRLVEQVREYVEVEPERYLEYLGHVAGRSERAWSPGDFEYPQGGGSKRRRKEDPEPARARWGMDLTDLSGDFLAHLRREKGVPYCRGDLARVRLVRYLESRAEGGLKPQAGSARAGGAPAHVLAPDGSTLRVFLEGMMHSLVPRYWSIVALLDAIPSWLSFLESRGLIDAAGKQRSLESVADVVQEGQELLPTDETGDPALADALANWPQSD